MEGDFESLFELAAEDRSVSMLESIFGGIITLMETGTAGGAGENWLNTAVQFFNLGCLLIMLGITLYTILIVIFDTAKDGTAFGQQTSTSYTAMRVLLGAIAFVPVSAGYSMAQVVLLWLVVQGTAMADAAWNRIAVNELDGNTFIAPGRIEAGTDDLIVRQEFARAFDALVVGNMCAQTLNQIAATLAPVEGDETPIAPMRLVTPDLIVNEALFSNTITAIREIYYADTQNVLRNSRALCGGVSFEAPWSFTDEDPDGDAITTEIFRMAMTNAAQARMASYTDTITALNGEAAALASQIRNGTVDAVQIQTQALAAVDAARINFVSGAIAANAENVTDEAIAELGDRLLDKVSVDGWVMAAAWQRGISRAVADQRNSFSDFNLDVTREANVERFLNPRGWNGGVFSSRSSTVDALLSDLDISMEAWNTVAPQVAAATRGRSGSSPTSLSSGGGEEMSGALGRLAELMIDAFSPRDGEGYSDPMVDITEYGFGLMKVGGLMVGSGVVADVVGGIASFTPARAAAPILDGLADHVLYPVGWTLLMAGFFVASILPMIPIVYFLAAVASWLILVLESVFAIPLAVLSLFTPSRDGTLIGSWNKILLTIFGVFLRPLFTIIGLFAGMLLVAIVLDFSYDLFRSMVVMVAPTPSILNIFTMLGVGLVSVVVSFYIVLLGSQMITQIGDGAMNWLGIGLSAAGNSMSIGQQVQARTGVEGGALPNRLGLQGGAARMLPGGSGGGSRPPGPQGGPSGSGSPMQPKGGGGGGSTAPTATRAALLQGDVGGARASAASGAVGTSRQGASRGLIRDAAFKAGRQVTKKGRE